MLKNIIIDTDCGTDDALALLYALDSDKFKITGITTVFGNVTAKQAAFNVSYILRLTGKENIPLAIGQEKPINQPLRHSPPSIHGEYGLGTITSTYMSKTLRSITAVEFIIDTISKSKEKITFLSIGPLTNIGLALTLRPEIAENIEEIIIMGGAYLKNGNVTPAAEANIYSDAVAAEKIFSSPCQVTMVGLDVTTKVIMSKKYLETMSSHKKYGAFIKSLTSTFYNFLSENFNINGIFPHDLVAIFYAADKSLFKTINGRVYVNTQGLMLGQTYIDRRKKYIKGTEWDNRKHSKVCTEVNAEKLLDEFRKF